MIPSSSPPKKNCKFIYFHQRKKITANLSLGSDFILEFHGLFLPLFCFLLGLGGRLFPPIKSRGFVTLTVTPPRSWGSRNLPLALGSGWSWTPETRWRDVASETWPVVPFFQWRVDTYDRCHFAKGGGKGGYGYTVCSHVKKCQICRIFWRDLVSGEIMKLTRWLSASAHFTVVLLVDTPLAASCCGHCQLAGRRRGQEWWHCPGWKVPAACHLFLLQATNMFCVSKHAAIMANGGLWWYLQENRYGVRAFYPPIYCAGEVLWEQARTRLNSFCGFLRATAFVTKPMKSYLQWKVIPPHC